MRRPICFTVTGHAAPKGSRTAGIRKDGSRFSRPASKREHPWVEAVAKRARVYRPCETLEPPYDIELEFALPQPQKPKYGWPVRDGDLDKLVRAVLDGLVKGELIVDDRHVTKLTTTKRFAEPIGVVISIA